MDLSLNRVVSYLRHRRGQKVTLDKTSWQQLTDLLALLRPQTVPSLNKIRVGTSRDGGYVMLDDFAKLEVAVSLGIGPDVSWDYFLAERGIKILQYDPTVTGPPREHPLFRFESKRIVTRSCHDEELEFSTLLEELVGKSIVVKMDIEGAEWEILAHLPAGLLGCCRQFVVEFHDFQMITDPKWRSRAHLAFTQLTRDFGVVHVHGNNLSRHLKHGGVTLPDALEVTFVNRHLYRLEISQENFPGSWDRRNNIFFPDFHLGRFDFSVGNVESSGTL